MKFVPGCACCCAAATVTASATCSGTLSGVTFELLDSTGTTVLATLTGSSVSFTGLDGTLSYKVRVSKTGYRTQTSGTLTPGCGGTSTVAVATWPTTYNLTVNVVLHDGTGNCPLSGATVTISGDGSGSGTTDASGNVTISLTSTTTSVTQSLSYSISPPSGTGAATKTGSFSISACAPTTQNVTLIPDASHVAIICNTRYMPSTLTWTDDFGSCTLTNGGVSWSGSYTYSTTGINTYTCSTGGFPPTITDAYPDQPSSVTVNCYFSFVSRSSCSSSTFTILRDAIFGELIKCATSTWRCQPVDDSLTPFGPPAYASTLSLGPVADVTSSCGTSLSFAFAINAASAVQCATYQDTAVSVTVTGTI